MTLKISLRQVALLVLLFAYFFSYSQTKTISGIVSDTINTPLENANIIAKPSQTNQQLKFSITDNKGRFRLELDSSAKYEIVVSYIGFVDQVLVIEPNSTITSHDFKLKSTGEKLKEIVIKQEFKAIIIKKDTMTFNVKSFANGNERKMKEILEKLPGVEVEKNGNVTVQGKKVTKMLVEGKSFFGGGTKLAVENIPADALDKIEVIDHFNDVGFMKKVSDSDDLVMNVKLKDDKKKFIFGDVQAGIEVANDNGFYLAHAGIFYYSPKTNISYIGDSNNIGKSTFTFEDLMQFEGGASRFLSGRKSLTNLYTLTDDNTDVVLSTSQFSAINFSHDVSPKLSLSGYAIFSKIITRSHTESRNEYLQNALLTFENQSEVNQNNGLLGIGNIKLDYSPTDKEKWYYNSQYQSSNNDINNTINSVTDTNSSLFETINKADNFSFKNYIEWHKEYNQNHSSTFVINQAYEVNSPTNHLLSNAPFLENLIPFEEDNLYIINQVKRINNNSVDALFKHYWILNKFNHLYINLGNNYETSYLTSNENQLLTDGTINNLENAGFSNNIKYNLNDSYVGLEYKFKIGGWTNKPGLYIHRYHLVTRQDLTNTLNKTLLQPQWTSDYEFNQSENIKFEYLLSNKFPDVNQYAKGYTLKSYNSIFKGNALLENEQYHLAYLRYSKVNMYRGIVINAMINFNKKIKTIRNEVLLNGINQLYSPILTDNPETNWRIKGAVSKKIYKFNLKLNTNLTWFNYTQKLNTVTSVNSRNTQEIGILLKTANKKWPDLSIGYTKGFSSFEGITTSKYQNDMINSDLEIAFFKSWIFKFDYEYLKNTNNDDQKNYSDIANTSLRYQKKNSPITFEVSVNNLFNVKNKNSYTFSDYIISQQATYILPRVILFSINYKL